MSFDFSFGLNFSSIYLLLAFAYRFEIIETPPRMPCLIIRSISGAERSLSWSLVFFRQASQATQVRCNTMLDPIHSSSYKHFWNFQRHLQEEECLSWDTDYDITGKLSSCNVSTSSVHAQSLCLWYHSHSTLNKITPLAEDFFQTVFPVSQTNHMERLPFAPTIQCHWIQCHLMSLKCSFKFLNWSGLRLLTSLLRLLDINF